MRTCCLVFPSSAEGGTGVTIANFREWNVSSPISRMIWRINNRLTLNGGIRYDYFRSPSDANGHSNVYDLPTNTNHPGTFHQQYLNFAPRVGFAYLLNNNATVRGGYGIYYSPFQYNQLQFLMINEPNFFLQLNTYALGTLVPVTNTFVSNPTLSAEAPFTIQLHMKTPYVQQWNLSVQQSLGPHWLATISYLGNKSDHLQIRQNPNQASLPADPSNPGSIQSRRPYSYVGDVYQIASAIGYGNYNALEGELERRFTNGLSMHANYVWSKSMDALNNGASNPQYGPDVQAEYGQSDFNPGQVFKLSGVYELPFGQGKQFLGSRTGLPMRWLADGREAVSLQCRAAFRSMSPLPIFPIRVETMRKRGKPGLSTGIGRPTNRLLSGSIPVAMCRRVWASLATNGGQHHRSAHQNLLTCRSSRLFPFEKESRCSSVRIFLIR